MLNFTTRKEFLVPSFDLDLKDQEKMDKFLLLLQKSNVEKLFPNAPISSKGGRPHYSYYDLFATILYGFAFGSGTLRDLEDSCKYDLRYFYLMSQERPHHSVFGNFINDFIAPNRDEIFCLITNAICTECNVLIDDVFMDGSKFEANANKYKFVWKPTKFHENLSNKIRTLLNEVNLSKNIPEEGIINSKLVAQKVSELSELLKENTKLTKQYKLLCEYLAKSLEYEEKERICGDKRNSYYKTDHDATAMCLKEDYYSGLGSNMHAGYNMQIAVSKGIICEYYVSQSRNDINDFISIIQKFEKYYSYYSKRICADAGYGSETNYLFLKENDITSYVKHISFEGNVSGKNPDSYHLNEDKTITCLNGNTGVMVDIPNRHPKKAESVFYKIEGCDNCNFKMFCKRFMKNKDENYKIFEVNQNLTFLKQESFENLLSPKGIEMRVNRSCQVEGAFGVVKQDMDYERLRRISLEKVETEFMLVCLGYNIRKLFKYINGKSIFNYWTAPANLKAEIPKKPNAKRLTRKANKTKAKSDNQKAKEKYKKKYK